MRCNIIHTSQEFREWMKVCKGVDSLDFETTSLNWLDLEVVGFSICDGRQACYVVANSKDKQELLNILEYYLSEAALVIFHNFAYSPLVF